MATSLGQQLIKRIISFLVTITYVGEQYIANASKMYFKFSRVTNKRTYQISVSYIIQEVQQAKYLGVTFS